MEKSIWIYFVNIRYKYYQRSMIVNKGRFFTTSGATENNRVNTGLTSEFAYAPLQICSGLNANEIQIPYDKHHKVASLVKDTKTHTILSNMKEYENVRQPYQI